MKKPIVMDFDDYCNATVSKLPDLYRLKEKMPNLLVTLFTVPGKCSPATIATVKQHDWITLGMHGWRHTLGECWSWTSEEAAAKMKLALEMGIDGRVFRAPHWIIDAETYYAAKDLDWVIADHKDFRVLNSGCRVYTYNKPVWNPRYARIHGHLPNVCGNGISEAFGRFVFAPDSTFVKLTDAAEVDEARPLPPPTELTGVQA